jgi:hypothetical protein
MENGFYEAFSIEGGRKHFYQWDLNQKIVVNDRDIDEVHFCNGTTDKSLVSVVKDGIADVPNILLQTAGKVKVYGYSVNHTVAQKVYEVKARTKPEDYLYEETEILRWAELDKRILALEEPEEWQENLKDSGLFVIRLRMEYNEDTGTTNMEHDYTISEIRKMVEDGKTLLLRDTDGRVYQYLGEMESTFYGKIPTFVTVAYYNGNTLKWESIIINADYNAAKAYYNNVNAPNPQPLNILDTDGNIIKKWYGKTVLNITIPQDTEKLVDTVTGKKYKLCVTNGQINIVERT